MGHHLHGLIGRAELLRELPVPGLRLVTLPQAFALAPFPEAMITTLIGDRDMLAEEVLSEVAKVGSMRGEIVKLMSDHFGGRGSNDVELWSGGRVLTRDQNEAFAKLGVICVVPDGGGSRTFRFLRGLIESPPRPLDAWDSLELTHWRDTERAYELGAPVPRRDPRS